MAAPMVPRLLLLRLLLCRAAWEGGGRVVIQPARGAYVRCPPPVAVRYSAETAGTSAEDRYALKRAFKEVSGASSEGADATVGQFEQLCAEYSRLSDVCRTVDQRETLRRGWLAVGGLTAVAAATISEPALAVTLAGAMGSVALLDAIVEFAIPDEEEAAEAETARGEERGEGRGDGASSMYGQTVDDLYAEMDAAIDAADYVQAKSLKSRIDALKASITQASPLAPYSPTALLPYCPWPLALRL